MNTTEEDLEAGLEIVDQELEGLSGERSRYIAGRIAAAIGAEREKAWKDAIAIVKNQWRYPDDDYRAGAVDPDDLIETLEAANGR